MECLYLTAYFNWLILTRNVWIAISWRNRQNQFQNQIDIVDCVHWSMNKRNKLMNEDHDIDSVPKHSPSHYVTKSPPLLYPNLCLYINIILNVRCAQLPFSGTPLMTWMELVRHDITYCNFKHADPYDRSSWRYAVRKSLGLASPL